MVNASVKSWAIPEKGQSLKSRSEFYVMLITLYFMTGKTLFYWEILVVHFICKQIYKEEDLEELKFTIIGSINANVSIC